MHSIAIQGTALNYPNLTFELGYR